MPSVELWGGHECSVIRVGNDFKDQTIYSGHQDRLSDLEMFADLGIRKLRYPVLWERVSPDRPDEQDFKWTDERLAEIRRLGMKPIVGLLHHGSGPRYTEMLDKGFAPGLARHARATAERYPWVEDWNPVNEPLTTARFSFLYGVWYPHGRCDEGAFWAGLLNEVNAVRLAMHEIRKVNPKARLLQTEDLGYTHATPRMAEQRDFENHRRWITWDLLSGRVTPEHPLWVRIAAFGLHDRLKALADDPCPPDLLGANYYASSERVLDHNVDGYPEIMRGHDGPGDYVNADAVRSIARPLVGVAALLEHAWQRYGIPLGMTETHNVGTRDEQMRWILEIWRTCEALRKDGIAVESVTAWSLLGAFDWKTLGVKEAWRYEVGVFDLGSGEPRPTAVAELLPALAAGRKPPQPLAFTAPGWWRRDVRFDHDTEGRGVKRLENLLDPGPMRPMPAPEVLQCGPLLITGKTGTLGRAFIRACVRRGLPFHATDRTELRLEDRDSIRAVLRDVKPCVVVNAAGFSSVEQAEEHTERARQANAVGPANLARMCRLRGIPLITFSSDLVFDGTKGSPYVETDEPNPLNAYGRGKREGELRVMAAGGRTLVVRSATYFSPYDSNNFAVRMLNDLADGQAVTAASDCMMSPTYVPDLVDAVLDLAIDGETGIWHLTNPATMSWADFARFVAEEAGFDPGAITPQPARELGWHAPRPRDVSLSSIRGGMLSDARSAIERFLADTRHAPMKKTPHASADVRDPVITTAAKGD